MSVMDYAGQVGQELSRYLGLGSRVHVWRDLLTADFVFVVDYPWGEGCHFKLAEDVFRSRERSESALDGLVADMTRWAPMVLR